MHNNIRVGPQVQDSMYNNTRVGPTVQDSIDHRLLQIKPLKIFGGIHIAFGLGITILSTIAVAVASNMEDNKCLQNNFGYGTYYNRYNCNNYKLLWIIFGTTCLILSGWFVMTGALPFCMTEKRITSWRCLKTAFMVCCILSALIFGLTVLFLGVTAIVVENSGYVDKSTGILIIFVLLSVIAFCEEVLSIITASYCCCCSHLTASNQTEMTTVESSLRTTVSMPQMPQMPVHSGNPQGYPNMWLMPGQNGGQQVLYHVVGMSPAQGGFNQNTIYPSAPVLDQPFITQQQPNVYTEQLTTSGDSKQ